MALGVGELDKQADEDQRTEDDQHTRKGNRNALQNIVSGGEYRFEWCDHGEYYR